MASQFERCHDAPFFRPLQKSSTSRDSVSEVQSGEGTKPLSQKDPVQQEKASREDSKVEEVSRKESRDERRESREERRDAKDERKEKGDSLPRGVENGERMSNDLE